MYQFRVVVHFDAQSDESRTLVVSASNAREAASLAIQKCTGGRYVECIAVQQIGARFAPRTFFSCCIWTEKHGFEWIGQPLRRA